MNRRDRDPELYHKGRKCPGGFYQKDYWREPPVRYLGYANEIGEALRGHIGGTWVSYTYMIAAAYILGDTLSKAKRVYDGYPDADDRIKRSALQATDTFTWQFFASVAIPGLTINRICAGTNWSLKFVKKGRKYHSYIATVVGLISIPFIIKPIDDSVTFGMNRTLRKWYKVDIEEE